MTEPRDISLPVACTLTPDDLKARRGSLMPGLAVRAQQRTSLPDGIAWRFDHPDAQLLGDLAAMMAVEKDCCAFLRLVLTIEPGGGPATLEVTGPPGTVEFLNVLTL